MAMVRDKLPQMPTPPHWAAETLWNQEGIRLRIDETFSIFLHPDVFSGLMEWCLLRKSKKILKGSAPFTVRTFKEDVETLATNAVRQSMAYLKKIADMYASGYRCLSSKFPEMEIKP